MLVETPKPATNATRTRCRRCSVKLSAPVENPRSAFCCSGCHRNFYRTRCFACEQPMVRKTAQQRLCGRRKCAADFRALKRHSTLGRYQTPHHVNRGHGNSTNIGVPERAKADRPWRIVAGPPTSPEQLRLATVGSAIELDRRLNRRHRLEDERAEIEANGHFENTEWHEITSSDGVRCFVAEVDAP